MNVINAFVTRTCKNFKRGCIPGDIEESRDAPRIPPLRMDHLGREPCGHLEDRIGLPYQIF